MKSKYLGTLFIIISSLAGSSCSHDLDNNMVDDSISYLKDDIVKEISVFDEGYNLFVIKSGKGSSSADVTLSFADSALSNYNNRNSTNYKQIDPSLYSVSNENLHFDKSDIREVSSIAWDQNTMLSSISDSLFVIPCKLICNDLETNPSMDLTLLNIKRSKIKMESSLAATITPTADETLIDTLSGNILIDIPITRKDLEISLTIDTTLVDDFNTSNNTSYGIAPDGLITLESESITLYKGENTVSFKYILDGSKFYNNGSLIPFDRYLIPIRISSISISGVEIRNSVMYIPVVNETKTIMGPWTVLEGAELCYGNEPDSPNWAKGYLVDRMVDGNLSTEWISLWDHDNVFPMAFVFDMGEMHLFNNFKIKDFMNYQGAYREYEIYMAKEYSGDSTNWVLVASGRRGYNWVPGGDLYDFPVQNSYVGRYLKFVIVKPERTTGDYIHGRGKLSEIYGEGL